MVCVSQAQPSCWPCGAGWPCGKESLPPWGVIVAYPLRLSLLLGFIAIRESRTETPGFGPSIPKRW